MGAVIKTWAPLIYLSYPSTLTNLTPPSLRIAGRQRSPKLDRIVLDVFHESKADRMHWTCFCSGNQAQWSHPELVAAWASMIPQLPTNIKEMYLDITPAPAERRQKHRVVINPFLHDKRTMTFLDCHTRDVGMLARAIHERYTGQVQVRLTGKLSEKASRFLTGVRIKSELELEYVGLWITGAEAKYARIRSAVERIAPRHEAERHQRQGEKYVYAKFRNTVWSKETKWLYARLVDDGEEKAASRDLKLLAEFSMDEERLTMRMDPSRDVRRAFQHRIAQDLDFKTGSEESGKKRHVVVWKA